MGKQLEAYTQEVGGIEESFVFQFCSASRGENSTALVIRGWNLGLSKSLLQTGRNVIFVHHKLEALRNARAEVRKFVTRRFQFRTICRPLESEMSRLATKVSAILILGALHHATNPQSMLAWLLRTGRPLVVRDTTSELMYKKIIEDARLHRICDEHFECRNGAINAGLNVKADIEELLMGKNCVRWPQLFEYGDFAWLAVWEGA